MLALPLRSPLSDGLFYRRHPHPSPRPWSSPYATPPSLLPPQDPIPSPADGRRGPLQASGRLPLTTAPPEAASSDEETARISRLRLRRMIESGKLDDARKFHARMRSGGVLFGPVLESVLINALMRSGRISEASLVFGGMNDRNVVTWTSMISGCVHNGRPEMAFPLLVEMMESGVPPNDFSFNSTLQACAALTALGQGMQIHSLIIRSGLEDDTRIGNCLVDFYSRCGSIDEAVLVFDSIPDPDVVSFTCLIAGFSKNKLLDSAAGAFVDLIRCGVDPNEHTIATILMACHLPMGKQIHGYMIKAGVQRNLYASSALIEFYSRNDCFSEAWEVFSKLEETKSVVTWSSMISCCLRDGREEDALRVFYEMISSDTQPNEYTFATLIGACGNRTNLLPLGRQLHGSTIKLGFSSDNRICNALITMYARNSAIKESETLFDKSATPDVVTWSGVISGYFQNGFHERSASFLCRMHRRGLTPNEYGFSSAISSCGNLSLLDQGRQLHSLALKTGCDLNLCVGNALISMYSKCGCVEAAKSAFDTMPARDTASWNSVIHGYAHAGRGTEALQMFDEMRNAAVPDGTTFVAVLAACSHAGHADRALEHLKTMQRRHGVAPSVSHYACAVDALGRAGRLLEAARVVGEMPFEVDCLAWKTLLAACRRHGSVELAELAARRVMEMEPEDSASYVLLSNLHAARGEWEEVKRLRRMMEDRGVRKEAAWSWVEVGNQVHAFVSTDKSHPSTEVIYRRLEELSAQMREEGYAPALVNAPYEW